MTWKKQVEVEGLLSAGKMSFFDKSRLLVWIVTMVKCIWSPSLVGDTIRLEAFVSMFNVLIIGTLYNCFTSMHVFCQIFSEQYAIKF